MVKTESTAPVGFDVEDLCLSFLVRQAWMSMRTSIDTALSDLGLSVAQYACLLALERYPGISIADLGRAMSSTRQSMNELLRGLADQELVERRQHETDRRSQIVFLTGTGRERLDQARPLVSEREQELEKAFTPRERSAARSWLQGVVRAAG